MLSFEFIVNKAVQMGLIGPEDLDDIHSWLDTPWSWAAQRGLLAHTTEN